MMTAAELRSWQKKCEARIEECFVIAEKHFNRKIPRPQIEWSTQQKKTAGTALSSFGGMPVRIKLSLQILALNGQEFCDRTPGHEAAHLIQAYIDGRSDGHGYRWKSVMRLLGQEASRCHSMNTMDKADMRHFGCSCPGQVHKISASRKKTIQGIKWGTVTCRRCKQKLVEVAAPSNSETQKKMQMAKAAKMAIKEVVKNPVAVKPKATKKVAKPAAAKKVAKPVAGARKFADIVREVLDANPTKSYEQIVQLLIKIEPNKSKCRCYARDFMIKRGTYK